jgi:hypothetical protein
MTVGRIHLQKVKCGVRAIGTLLRLCARRAISYRRRPLSLASFLNEPEQLVLTHSVKTHHFDSAAVLTTAVFQILETVPEQECRRAIEDYLRDELTDLTRQALADREPPDA